MRGGGPGFRRGVEGEGGCMDEGVGLKIKDSC